MVEGGRKCPFCAEEIKAEAVKCKHCGSEVEREVPRELGMLEKLQIALMGVVGFALFFGLMWLLIGFEAGAFDDPPPPPPQVPEGGVRYEGQIYGKWENRPLAGLNRALQKHGAFCPDYRYRESVTSSSEYIVYCLMEYEGRMVAVDAYVVFPRVGTVIGPVNPDKRLE